MTDKEHAWSEQAYAVYEATVTSIDGLKTYGEKMNLLLNLTRYVTMTETANEITEQLGKMPGAALAVELSVLIQGTQILVDEFAAELKKMPRRMGSIIHAEQGCGTCAHCEAAKKAAYGDGAVRTKGSKAAEAAIEGLINTMLGKQS
jgi:hypothetical protein